MPASPSAADKERRIQELEKELAYLRSHGAGAGATSDNPDVFRSVLSKYKNVKRLYFDLKAENEALQNNLANTREAKDKIIESWKNEYGELTKKLRQQDETEAQVKSWRDKYNMVVALQASIHEDATGTADKLRDENRQLTKQVTRLEEEAASAAEVLRQENQRLASEIKLLQDASAETTGRLKEENGRLADENQQLHDQVRRMTQEMHQQGGEMASLRQDMEARDKELKAAQEERDALSAAVAELGQEKECMEKELEENKVQLEAEREERRRSMEVMKKMGALWIEAQSVLGIKRTDCDDGGLRTAEQGLTV